MIQGTVSTQYTTPHSHRGAFMRMPCGCPCAHALDTLNGAVYCGPGRPEARKIVLYCNTTNCFYKTYVCW